MRRCIYYILYAKVAKLSCLIEELDYPKCSLVEPSRAKTFQVLKLFIYVQYITFKKLAYSDQS